MQNQEAKRHKWKVRLCFAGYMAALFYFLFLAKSYGRTTIRAGYHFNLIPFREISRFLDYRDRLGVIAVLTNLGGNIAGFVPFGFFLPLLNRKLESLMTILVMSLELSLIIEVSQLVLRVGSFDVDDLILNTLGGMLGYGIYSVAVNIWRKSDG